MPGNSDINQTVKLASSINLLLGSWLIVAPWMLGYAGTAAMWNDVVVGVAIAVLAGVKLANPVRFAGISWINVALGFWLFVAPFVLQYGGEVVSGVNRALWNDIFVAILVIVLSWLSATMVSKNNHS